MRYYFEEMVEEAEKRVPFKGARIGLKLRESHVVISVLDEQDRLLLRPAAFRYEVLRHDFHFKAVLTEIEGQARHAAAL